MTGAHQAPRSGPAPKLLIAAAVVVVAVIASATGFLLTSGHGHTDRQAGRSTSDALRLAGSNGSAATQRPGTRASAGAGSRRTAFGSAHPDRATGAQHRKAPLTYVVQPGDNLTAIAKWFHLRGYGRLYERNKSVLGDDPDLIRPGQRITISSRGMTVQK